VDTAYRAHSIPRFFSLICRFLRIVGAFFRSIYAQIEFVFSERLLMLKEWEGKGVVGLIMGVPVSRT